MKVGDTVYALGSPHTLKSSLTIGIISAIREKQIQIDAAIAPGSSRGPLFNEYGEIVGINTEKYNKGTQGFNFAIPSDKIQKWLKEREKEIKTGEIKGESKIKNNLAKILCSGSDKGCHVYGKIKYVNYGENYKVKVVKYSEDLKVKVVKYGENSVGKWKIVNYGKDYKIKIVKYGENFKVKFVNYGEGCK